MYEFTVDCMFFIIRDIENLFDKSIAVEVSITGKNQSKKWIKWAFYFPQSAVG